MDALPRRQTKGSVTAPPAMWVKFLSDFNFRPPEMPRRVCIAYKAGMVKFVRRVCASEAIARGIAEPAERPH